MRNPNTIENELNKIRVSLYEETKGMSPSEITAYIKSQTTPIHQKYAIHTVNGSELRGKYKGILSTDESLGQKRTDR